MNYPAELTTPPLVSSSRAEESLLRTRREAMFVLLAASIGLVGARIAAQWKIVLPCLFKLWTHLPCPFCGGTRSFAALGRGDLVSGFYYNPLAAVTLVGVMSWSVWACFRPGKRLFFEAWPLKAWVLLFLLNWSYLILFLRR